MVSAKVQLRVVAALYALLGIVIVSGIVIVWTVFSTKPEPASAIPSQAAKVVGSFALSVLSLRLLTLSRSWRIATALGSLLVSVLIVLAAARVSGAEIPVYFAVGPESPSDMAVALGIWWGLALVYSMCSYVVWRQARASNHR